MREDREELLLHLVELTQPRGHGVEGPGQHAELVVTADGNRLAERARRDGGRRLRQPSHRARDPERDHRGGRQRQDHGGAQRDDDPVPRPPLQPCDLGLGPHDARVRGLLQALEVRLELLGHAPSDRLELGASIGPQTRVLVGDGGAVPLEGLGGRGEMGLLPVGVHERLKTLEVVAHALGRLAPEVGVPAIAQHHEARLQARQRQHRVAHARAQAQGGQRLHRDLPVDGHQPSDGAQTDDAHRRQHDDDQGEPQEDFRRESHAVSFAAHRPAGSAEAVATGAAGARSVAVSLAMSRRCSSETRTSTTESGPSTVHDLRLSHESAPNRVPDQVYR